MALITWNNRLNREHKWEHWKRKNWNPEIVFADLLWGHHCCCGLWKTSLSSAGSHLMDSCGGKLQESEVVPRSDHFKGSKPLIIQTNKNRLKAKLLFLKNLPLVDWSLHKGHQGLDFCCRLSVKNGCLWSGEWQQDTLKETQSKLFDEMTAGIYSWRLLPNWCQVRFEPAIYCKSLPWKSAF